MFNLNFSFLPLLFIILSVWDSPAFALKRSYIVYMGEHSEEGLELTKALLHNRTDSRIEFLGSFLGCKKKAKDAIFYSYRRHINGFAAELEEEDVAAIQKNPMVVSVFPNEERQLQTSYSWDFLSLERNGIVPSDSLWTKARFGEDIIIATIDSGVWPESPSFSDEGFGPIPPKWKGRCQKDGNSPFPCNRKLIGAKYFYKGYLKAKGNLTKPIIDTPRDYYGHGTHTLSTAGGNFVPGASFLGMYNATTKGGLPKARVATYKVCEPSCWDADIMKAFDHAIDDGVDVISISIRGDSPNYYDNGIAVGAFSAIKHGIAVIAAAGNDGPIYGTVSNVAPWIITVGASTTDREYHANVQLQNGMRLKGVSLTKPLPEERFYPLISGADARAANGSAWEALLCRLRALDPEKVKGKILVCLKGEIPLAVKGKHAALTGAVGMILCNDEISGNDLSVEPFVLPATSVEFGIKPAPQMASFSSRGPNSLTPEILKPDITAPGVNIMAAYTEGKGPTDMLSDQRRTKYAIMTGTSMSSPHVGPVVGLLKVLHPDWSPAAIRSALMTTASTIDNTGRPMLDQSLVEATPLSYGAGHIRPDLTVDPGLVYDLSGRDYDNFLCATGYNQTIMKKFTKSHTCLFANTLSLLDFNYPSITVPKLSGSVTVNRILKNVGSPGVYVAQMHQPLGVSVSVQPNTLYFGKTGEKRRFQLTMTRNATSVQNTYLFGELLMSDGRHNVRSPIVLGTTA
ncbi:hypothetical protein Pfo_014413 [Paulownia fortunei]|nr:hypothetical protein Pfo_014413 [Paulownia fortunei]